MAARIRPLIPHPYPCLLSIKLESREASLANDRLNFHSTEIVCQPFYNDVVFQSRGLQIPEIRHYICTSHTQGTLVKPSLAIDYMKNPTQLTDSSLICRVKAKPEFAAMDHRRGLREVGRHYPGSPVFQKPIDAIGHLKVTLLTTDENRKRNEIVSNRFVGCRVWPCSV